MRLRLPKDKIVLFAPVFPNDIDKRIDRKRIVLTGNGKMSAADTFSGKFLGEKIRLLQYLPGVGEKQIAFVCDGHAPICPAEYRYLHFFFQFAYSIGKARLRKVQPFCRFGYISGLCNLNHIFQL